MYRILSGKGGKSESFMNMGKKEGGVGLLQPDVRETQRAGREMEGATPQPVGVALKYFVGLGC
jgi:hypothetical protein